MIQRIRIGNNISINWLLYEDDGNIHNLEGKTLELYMTCGGYKYPVTDYTLTENALAWVFPAALQTKTGYYDFVLLERDPARGLYSYDVAKAFCLEPKCALTNIETIIDEDATIRVRSVLTYAHITNLASVDTVETEEGNVAVVHLTNGKTFNIPVGGSGGGGGSTFVLLPATATQLGGLKVGFTQTGRKFPVKLDEQNKAFVEVPAGDGINVHDGLYSTSKDDALSANAGRVLRELIENIPTGGGGGGDDDVTVGSMSRYVIYKDEDAPEINHQHGGFVVRFKSAAACWDKVPNTGQWALYGLGDGYLYGSEVVVTEEDGDTIIYSNNHLGQIQIYIADIEAGGGGGTPGDPGDPGRSITGVQHWFKLCADESVQATPMNVADPSSSAGGSWSQTAGTPSAQYPYLRCFMQVNYDTPLASGYTYTRSSAFTARYFNSDSSVQFNELVDAISSLRSDLLAEVADRESAITALNAALEGLRSTISGSVANQIAELRNRLNQINGTDVELIRDNGLWAVLTSWQNETGNKKAFADILLQAENAKAQLQTGSTFFDRTVGGSITLDGILGQINAKVTRQDVNAMIASAQFSVDPASLNSVISKSQACWKKNGILYPYDLYLADYMTDNPSGTLADYETYMTAQSDGPSGDSDRPAGPFELVVVVEQFSAIKQTMDEISASVDTTKYMWQKGNQFASYNSFETNYENRSSAYSAYTYEQYVTNVLGYTKVEVGAALSNITQTSDEIKAQLGDMGYFWRKPASGGGYEYQRYAVPSNTTRDAYVAAMQAAGWTLYTYASRMSVIDQFPDSITALVKNSTLCWVDETATGAAYCRDYDYWQTAYQNSGSALSYEEWVAANHSSYELTAVTDSFSRIKQTADSITSAVADIDGHETRLSAVEQTAEEISLAVSKSHSCWKDNATGELYEYDAFQEAYEEYKEGTQYYLRYEQWVTNTQNCTLSDSFTEVSGIKLQGDKIWAGVGDGDDLKASIEIIANSEVDGETGSKIILDADNVIINGGLQAGVVKAGTIDAKAVTTEKLDTGAVTAAKIDAGAVITEKLAAGAVTAGKIDAGAITTEKLAALAVTAAKIAAGTITADKIATGVLEAAFASILEQLTVGENSNIVLEDGLIKFYDSNEHLRMQLGQGENDDTPVLKFFDTDGETELYDLGPNGITQLGYTATVPEWRATRFRYTANKLTRNSQYNPASYQAVTLYQYTDATRVTVIGNVSGGLQFYNPITKQWQNEHSPYHEKFFNADNGLFVAPTAGYYLAYSYRTDGVTANVPLYDFSASAVAALGTYFLGSMALKNVDVTTMKGTVDAWNDYDAQ